MADPVSPPPPPSAWRRPDTAMTRRWLSRTVDILAVLMIVYVMPVVFFYGLSVRQLVAFRATLAWWVHWMLWRGLLRPDGIGVGARHCGAAAAEADSITGSARRARTGWIQC